MRLYKPHLHLQRRQYALFETFRRREQFYVACCYDFFVNVFFWSAVVKPFEEQNVIILLDGLGRRIKTRFVIVERQAYSMVRIPFANELFLSVGQRLCSNGYGVFYKKTVVYAFEHYDVWPRQVDIVKSIYKLMTVFWEQILEVP